MAPSNTRSLLKSGPPELETTQPPRVWSRKWLLSLIPIVIGASLSHSISSAFFPASKTYYQYANEVLASRVPEEIASTSVNQWHAEAGANSNMDWSRVESAYATCLRSEILTWQKSGDPRLNFEITKADVTDWIKPFVLKCRDSLFAQMDD